MFVEAIVFAVDSIPAVFAVTTDPFIVYTSNVFAILGLGLRSLYFVFANIIDKFYYLKHPLAVILTYVGLKMVLADLYPIPTFLSLAFIAVALAVAVMASVIRARHLARKLIEPEGDTSSSSRESVVSK